MLPLRGSSAEGGEGDSARKSAAETPSGLRPPPPAGEDLLAMSSTNLILVARVAGAFGVKGEVRLTAYTADPMALLAYRDLQRESGAVGLTLLGGRPHKGGIVGRAKEIET